MTTLVVGASGATGSLLVAQLLSRGVETRIIVRSPGKLPPELVDDPNLTVISASLLDLSDAEMAQYVAGCDAVASCLGHNVSFKGMYGQPRRLVTDAVRRLCDAIRANQPEQPVKFVLMNTTGNRNRDLNEEVPTSQRIVVWLLRYLLPPQADNEQAAEVLRTGVGQNDPVIEWTAVRPDGLVDADEVTEYDVIPSPTWNVIFGPSQVSRINVAHFMANLITDEQLFQQWKGQMPVIYSPNGDSNA